MEKTAKNSLPKLFLNNVGMCEVPPILIIKIFGEISGHFENKIFNAFLQKKLNNDSFQKSINFCQIHQIKNTQKHTQKTRQFNDMKNLTKLYTL